MRKKKTRPTESRTVPFGEAMAFLMVRRGLTVEGLAMQWGKEPEEIMDLIEGRAPPPEGEAAEELAIILEVDLRLISAAAKRSDEPTNGN